MQANCWCFYFRYYLLQIFADDEKKQLDVNVFADVTDDDAQCGVYIIIIIHSFIFDINIHTQYENYQNFNFNIKILISKASIRYIFYIYYLFDNVVAPMINCQEENYE